MNRFWIAVGILCIPANLAFAQTLSCTPNTVSVSNNAPTAGEVITIYTVTQNTLASPASHTVSFSIDGSAVGEQSVDLNPGEPKVVTASWTATPGTHAASATITSNGSGSANTVTTNPISISVANPLPPTAAQQTALQVSSAVQQGVNAAAPTVLGASNAVFKVTEKVRSDAIAAVERQLAKENAGEVLGVSDENLAAAVKAGSLFANLWNKLLRAALFVLKTQILFYGVAAVIAYLLLRLFMTWLSEHRRSSFVRH